MKKDTVKNVNRSILDVLRTAPKSQISVELKQKCIDFSGTDDELKLLFEDVYRAEETQVSSFVRQLVNPKHTRNY